MTSTANDLDFDGAASTRATIADLCHRTNGHACLQVLGHLTALALSTLALLYSMGTPWQVPMTLLQGFVLVTFFAPLHESVHYTAFKNRRANEWVGWFAGLPIGLNSTFYRQFHYAHHRHTQIPGKDPELGAPPPRSMGEYLVRISGWPYWQTRFDQMWRVCRNDFSTFRYVPKLKYRSLSLSMIAHLGVYISLLAYSLLALDATLFWVWLLPLLVGIPLQRFWLLCEHTGCTEDNNAFTNTRSTSTIWPLRALMWNMPYHAEHHLHPAIPFHALPQAHQRLRPYFRYAGAGYIQTNASIIRGLNEAKAQARSS